MSATLVDNVRRRFDGWGLASALAATLPLSALLGLVWLAAKPDAPVWAHLWAYVLPQQALTTFWLMLGVGALSAFIGTASAWMVTFYPIKMRRLIGWALLLPLAMPTYLMAYSYGDFLDEAGALYRLWQMIFPVTLYPDFRSLPGAVILLTLALYPYVYLSARTAFVQQSAVMIEAGRTLGLSPFTCFYRLGLPLARPAIIVGVALVLMECMNDIGAVEFLGVNTLTLGVYDTWVVRGNLAGAAQLALTLFGFYGAFAGTGTQPARQKRALSRVPVGSAICPTFMPHPPARLNERLLRAADYSRLYRAGFIAAGAFTGCRLAAQHDTSSLQLFRPRYGLSAGCAGAWPYPRLYRTLWPRNKAFYGSHGNARLCRARHGAGFGHYDGAGFSRRCQFWRCHFKRQCQALWYWLMSCAFYRCPFGTLEAGYGQIAPGLDMAAHSLGADKNATLRRVHLPLLRAPLVTAFLLVFVDVMKELPATLILRPFDFETLATHIYTYASLGQMEDAALPALIILAIGMVPVMLGIGVLERLRRR